VCDAEKSIEFYRSAFGFELVGEVMKDETGRVQHAGMRLGDAAIMFSPESDASPMSPPVTSGAEDSMTLYVYVPDVDALAARAARAGAIVLEQPADQFWGDRIAVFKCPNGYHWTFATHLGRADD